MSINKLENSILNIIRFAPIIFILLLSLFLTNIFIEIQNSDYDENIKRSKKEYLEKNKYRVKEEVEKVYAYIIKNKNSTKKLLKKSIKNKVNEAHGIALSIYDKYKDSKSKKEITEIIKTALKNIRFNEGRGYFFIYDLEGKNIFHATHPNREGYNFFNTRDIKGKFLVQESIDIAKSKDKEGFQSYFFNKPNDKSKEYRKISFIKRIEPYNWFIGSGEYIDDFENSLKEKMIRHIGEITYDYNGYIFLYDLAGNPLSSYKKDDIGKNRFDMKDKNGDYVLRKLIDFAKKEKSGYISYFFTFNPKKHKDNVDKTSYLKLLDDWNWMIGSGFYLDELEKQIFKKKSILDKKRESTILDIIYLSAVITLVLLIISIVLSNKLSLVFRNYKLLLKYESKEKEKELIRSEQLYKDLFESNKSIILLVNPKNDDIFNANKAAYDYYGYPKEKLLAMNLLDINILSKKDMLNEIENAKKSKRKYFNLIHKLANGELRNVRITSSIVKYLNMEVLFSVIIDSTDEFTIKNELEETEKEFKSLFEFSNIGLAVIDIDGKFVKINKRLLEMLGYKESFLLNKTSTHISTNETYVKENLLFEKLINKEIKDYNIEKTYIRKDRTKLEAILTVASILDKDNNIKSILSSIIDISEIKEKNRLLIQQSKMAVMGEMIGNIAHQWKQPLNIISLSNGNIKFFQENKEISNQEKIFSAVENINTSVQYLSDTIDDFTNFFRPDKEKSYIKLKTVYDKTFNLINDQLEFNNIQIISSIDDIEVYIYENELLQVFLNIFKNAQDELIKLSKDKKRFIFIDIYMKNNPIIKIRDNAGGIPDDIINHIFNAYFTTKKSDVGTGIGLYMCKQIIEGMGGVIEVSNSEYEYDNEKFSGAEFVIELLPNE